MSRLLAILALSGLGALGLFAAAPPPQPRHLTPQEEKEVAALIARRGRHGEAGEFEQSAKVAQQIADYRRERQGAAHWQTIDARFEVDDWRRRVTMPAKDRAEMVRARTLTGDGMELLNEGRFEQAEKPLRQVVDIY